MTDRPQTAEPARRVGLTRSRIVEAAIGILDREGLTGLSMRKLGAELSVEAMSLYQHFRNKEDLLAEVRDTLYAQITELPDGDGDWKTRLRTVMRSAYELYVQHPSFLVAVLDIPATPTSSLRRNRDLQTLRDAGFDEPTAQTGVSALVWQMIGALHQRRAYERMPPPVEPAAAFDFALDALLDGLEVRLRRNFPPRV